MSKPLKIALVYDAIYPFVKGGGERRFYEMGTRLARSGHDVHWYGMKFWDGPNVIKYDGMTLHGIMKARPLYTAQGRRSIVQALLFGLACFKLLGARFDAIDCCGFPYFSLFPAKLAAVLKRKALYATWHEVWGKKYWKQYLGVLGIVGYAVERLAAMLPDEIIAVSALTQQRLRQELHVSTPITVIPNGIDVEAMRKIKSSRPKSDVIYVGRIMDFKNVHYIIEALALVKGEGKVLTCTIIGEGPEKPRLQQMACELAVDAQIEWRGFVEDSNEVYAHMKASKLFVLPSQREGFGMVAIEANACGVPVVTFDHPDNAATSLVHTDKNGEIFKNVDDLAQQMQSFSRKRSKSKECISSAEAYDFNVLTGRIAGLYQAGASA